MNPNDVSVQVREEYNAYIADLITYFSSIGLINKINKVTLEDLIYAIETYYNGNFEKEVTIDNMVAQIIM